MMSEKVRWGILSTGMIAHKFANGLKAVPQAELVAVGSRSQESADAFGDEFDVPRRHASYEALAADEDVDVVYVATPHSFHAENSVLCLEAGRAVLCEKPFAPNADQARRIIQAARKSERFCMEGMWTRFFPLMGKVRRMIEEDALGEIRLLQVDFGFDGGWRPEGRLLNPNLAGGSLLDVGVYDTALTFMIFGPPKDVTSRAHIGETGVDEQAAWIFEYDAGRLAVCTSAVRTSTPMEATICGTKGRIRIHSPWWIPQSMTVSLQGKDPEKMDFPLDGNGMNYEAAAVMECITKGDLEHPVMPLSETLPIAETMDMLRARWGLRYPFEEP
jgi:predicted dehydrogenase